MGTNSSSQEGCSENPSEKMSCGHSRSEIASSRDSRSHWCGACEREAAKAPVTGIGTCGRCGHTGPGPGHSCRAKVEKS